MKVRLITINDAKGVFDVQKTTWLDVYPNEKHGIKYNDILEKFADEEKIINKLKKKIELYGKDACGWVLELDNKIVGFSTVSKDKEKSQVGATYVLPQYQGQGFGKVLLKEALEFLKNSEEVCLEVASYNKKAINFYKKFDFHVIDSSEEKKEIIKDKYIPTIEMKRRQC
ncbi:MAG: GNAT family N-acetyltransferase [Parcubacteria group bacterium]